MAEKARHFMIHKGKARVVTAAVTRTLINPETGEEETIEETPGKESTITLARGSSFGDYPVGVPIEVSDAKLRKALEEKGFEDYKPGKKEAGGLAEAPNGLSGRLAEVAERDRERALGRVRRMADSREQLDPEVRAEIEDTPEVLGDEGGKK